MLILGMYLNTLPVQELEENRNLTSYGAFVELEEGIDGMVCFRHELDS